jgi:hypothetical protein
MFNYNYGNYGFFGNMGYYPQFAMPMQFGGGYNMPYGFNSYNNYNIFTGGGYGCYGGGGYGFSNNMASVMLGGYGLFALGNTFSNIAAARRGQNTQQSQQYYVPEYLREAQSAEEKLAAERRRTEAERQLAELRSQSDEREAELAEQTSSTSAHKASPQPQEVTQEQKQAPPADPRKQAAAALKEIEAATRSKNMVRMYEANAAAEDNGIKKIFEEANEIAVDNLKTAQEIADNYILMSEANEEIFKINKSIKEIKKGMPENTPEQRLAKSTALASLDARKTDELEKLNTAVDKYNSLCKGFNDRLIIEKEENFEDVIKNLSGKKSAVEAFLDKNKEEAKQAKKSLSDFEKAFAKNAEELADLEKSKIAQIASYENKEGKKTKKITKHARRIEDDKWFQGRSHRVINRNAKKMSALDADKQKLQAELDALDEVRYAREARQARQADEKAAAMTSKKKTGTEVEPIQTPISAKEQEKPPSADKLYNDFATRLNNAKDASEADKIMKEADLVIDRLGKKHRDLESLSKTIFGKPEKPGTPVRQPESDKPKPVQVLAGVDKSWANDPEYKEFEIRYKRLDTAMTEIERKSNLTQTARTAAPKTVNWSGLVGDNVDAYSTYRIEWKRLDKELAKYKQPKSEGQGEPVDGQQPTQAAAQPTTPLQNPPAKPGSVDAYLEKDENYQGFKKALELSDAECKKLEDKYKFKRTDKKGFVKLEGEELISYIDNKLRWEMLAKGLSNYKQIMSEWQDGKKLGDQQVKNMKFTNIERITLTDGRRAYKSDQGYFLPSSKGLIGGPKVTDAALIPKKA